MFRLRKKNSLYEIWSSIGYILKWAGLSSLIGIIVGFSSALFIGALNWGINLLEPLRETSWVYILPLLGLGISGYISSYLSPNQTRHGTDAIINAYNKRWGQINIISIPINLITSIFTIAFGGSAGRVGPTVQMGGGLGYLIGKTLNLKLTDIRKMVICGLGASFGSIFTAPIAGGIFGDEILYRDDLEYNSLFISFISSITAFFVYSIILGQTRLFDIPTPIPFHFIPERDIPVFLGLGVMMGLISLFFIKMLYGYERFSQHIPLPFWARTALGGLFTGGIALIASPHILGTGLPLVEILSRGEVFSTGALLLMLVGKIAGTSFTIGSGASGGVVAPSLSIGALAGGFMASAFNYPYPLAFISACSVGVLGSAAHIPITTTLLAAEIFGLDMVKPATIVCFIGAWIARNDTLFRESYVSKAESSRVIHHFKYDKHRM